MSIDAYIQGFTTRFDQLAVLGKPFDLEDQIDYVLEGLPEDYKQIVDHIESRESPPSITEIHEKLLNHEVKLHAKKSGTSTAPVTANTVQLGDPTTTIAITIKVRIAATIGVTRYGNNNNNLLHIPIINPEDIKVVANCVVPMATALVAAPSFQETRLLHPRLLASTLHRQHHGSPEPTWL